MPKTFYTLIFLRTAIFLVLALSFSDHSFAQAPGEVGTIHFQNKYQVKDGFGKQSSLKVTGLNKNDPNPSLYIKTSESGSLFASGAAATRIVERIQIQSSDTSLWQSLVEQIGPRVRPLLNSKHELIATAFEIDSKNKIYLVALHALIHHATDKDGLKILENGPNSIKTIQSVSLIDWDSRSTSLEQDYALISTQEINPQTLSSIELEFDFLGIEPPIGSTYGLFSFPMGTYNLQNANLHTGDVQQSRTDTEHLIVLNQSGEAAGSSGGPAFADGRLFGLAVCLKDGAVLAASLVSDTAAQNLSTLKDTSNFKSWSQASSILNTIEIETNGCTPIDRDGGGKTR